MKGDRTRAAKVGGYTAEVVYNWRTGLWDAYVWLAGATVWVQGGYQAKADAEKASEAAIERAKIERAEA